ncbi:hypothetical protein WA026_002015, partial [Henosepilachna vigintioctopunctata]
RTRGAVQQALDKVTVSAVVKLSRADRGFTLPEHLSRTEVSNEHSGSVNSPLEPSNVRKGGSFVFVVDPPAVGFPPNRQRDVRSPLAQCKHHRLFTPIFAESNLVPGKLLKE